MSDSGHTHLLTYVLACTRTYLLTYLRTYVLTNSHRRTSSAASRFMSAVSAWHLPGSTFALQ